MASYRATFVILILAIIAAFAMAVDEKKAADCEVCTGLLTRFEAITKEKKLTDVEAIESMIIKECKLVTHPREKRLCWYLGAAKDSATNILREVSKPLTFGMPAEAICTKRLRPKDAAICGLRYEGSSVVEEPPQTEQKAYKPKPKPKPKINFDTLNKLKVKELKEIINKNGLDCSGCTEKGDYVRKIKTLQTKDEL